MALPTRVCLAVSIPGPNGSTGQTGADGVDGTSATTTLTAPFTQPAQQALANASVADSSVFSIGEPIFMAVAGTLSVDGIPDAFTLTLRNLRDDAISDYPNNAAAGVVVPIGALLSPTGFQGAVGVIAGAAVGGDLTGTLPFPSLAVVGVAGVAGDSTHSVTITTDAKGRVISAAAVPIAFPAGASPGGPAGGPDLTGNYPAPTLTPTGVTAATYGTAVAWPIISVDVKGRITSASEVANPGFLQREGLLGSRIGVLMGSTADQSIPMASTRAQVTAIVVTNASADLNGITINGGVYDALGKAGNLVAPVQQWGTGMGLIAPLNWMSPTLSAYALSTLFITPFIYFSLTTTFAGAATADIYVFGRSLS